MMPVATIGPLWLVELLAVTAVVLGYGLIGALIAGIITAAAAAHATTNINRIKKTVETGRPPGIGEFLTDEAGALAAAIPVAGPYAQAAITGQEIGPGQHIGAGLSALSLLGSAAGATPQVSAQGAEQIGSQAARHAALGMPVAPDIAAEGTIPAVAGAAKGPISVAEQGGPISHVAEGFSNIKGPADIGPAIQNVAEEARGAIRAPFEALGRATHPAVGNVAYRISAGAARGAASDPRRPWRGLAAGAAGSLGSIGAGEGAYAIRSGLTDLAAPKAPSAPLAVPDPMGGLPELGQNLAAQTGGQLASGLAFDAFTPRPPTAPLYQSPYPWKRIYGRRFV